MNDAIESSTSVSMDAVMCRHIPAQKNDGFRRHQQSRYVHRREAHGIVPRPKPQNLDVASITLNLNL